ncbi:MAG: ribonuclease HI [Acidiferrobacter sp.]
MAKVLIYTDGACRGNPGPGGWGAVLTTGDHERTLSGAETLTTNNRMEVFAAIAALRTLKRPCEVDLVTDSQYLRRGITEWLAQWKRRGWLTAARKPVANADLWRQLEEATVGHTIHWHWVKGHSGDNGNERADQLANEAIDRLLKDSA